MGESKTLKTFLKWLSSQDVVYLKGLKFHNNHKTVKQLWDTRTTSYVITLLEYAIISLALLKVFHAINYSQSV